MNMIIRLMDRMRKMHIIFFSGTTNMI